MLRCKITSMEVPPARPPTHQWRRTVVLSNSPSTEEMLWRMRSWYGMTLTFQRRVMLTSISGSKRFGARMTSNDILLPNCKAR